MTTLIELITCAVIPVTQMAILFAIGLALHVDRGEDEQQ